MMDSREFRDAGAGSFHSQPPPMSPDLLCLRGPKCVALDLTKPVSETPLSFPLHQVRCLDEPSTEGCPGELAPGGHS